jgi:hypothetical protein
MDLNISRLYSIFVYICIFNQFSFAQKSADSSATKQPLFFSAIVLDAKYGMFLAQGDMQTHFRNGIDFGARVNYFSRQNWIFAIEGQYFFNDKIRTDVVANLRNAQGFIVDKYGVSNDVKQGMRGFFLSASLGKLFLIQPQKRQRAGIETRLAVGYLQHWIRIKNTNRDLVQLSGDYIKGYDHLHAGIGVQPYVGFRYMSKNRLVNLFGGIDLLMGFTKNQRAWNYDEQKADKAQKLDLMPSLRVGISIPFTIYNAAHEQEEDIEIFEVRPK